jgi:hypothetical protein
MEKQDPIDDTEETQQKLVGYDPLGDPLAVAPLPEVNSNEVGFFAEIWQVLGRLFSNSGGDGGGSFWSGDFGGGGGDFGGGGGDGGG